MKLVKTQNQAPFQRIAAVLCYSSFWRFNVLPCDARADPLPGSLVRVLGEARVCATDSRRQKEPMASVQQRFSLFVTNLCSLGLGRMAYPVGKVDSQIQTNSAELQHSSLTTLIRSIIPFPLTANTCRETGLSQLRISIPATSLEIGRVVW